MLRLLVAAVAGLSLSACTIEPDPSGAFEGPPQIDRVLPLVAVSGGYIYVEGKNLATSSGEAADVTVDVVGPAASDDSELRVTLEVALAEATRLTLEVPADMHTRFSGPALVHVKTPEGEVEFPSPVFAIEDTGFGGAAGLGHGLLGTIFSLQPNTPVLPDFSDPCADPSVVATDEVPCPYSYILVPNLNVPDRSFDQGFPGLGENLVEWFAIRFEGFIDVPTAGSWTFETCSDDGTIVYVGEPAADTLLIDNDGTHARQCRSGTVELEAGLHPLTIDYFQGPRFNIAVEAFWTPPGGEREIIPAESIWLLPDFAE